MKIGILWDLDGTLLDTLQDIADAVNHVLARFGLPGRNLEEVRQFVGSGALRLMTLALPAPDGTPTPEDALGAFQEYYDTHCRIHTGPYAGIRQALEQLSGEYTLAIVSNKPDSAVKSLCGFYFPGLYARGESEDCPRKPAPDMVYKAMAAIGVEKCIYVGDSEVDVLTARNAGVPCLSVLWGFRDREVMEEAGGKYFCESPSDLPEAIAGIIARDPYF